MIEIKGRILNASGCWCDTREKIVELYNNPIFSGVISKTCTRYPKTGNPEPNYFFNEQTDCILIARDYRISDMNITRNVSLCYQKKTNHLYCLLLTMKTN